MHFLGLDPLLTAALQEDLGRGDVTTESILGLDRSSLPSRARLVAKQNLVLAGWPVFERVFQLLGELRCEAHFSEGEEVQAGQEVGLVWADGRVLLQGERVALNFLQRISGVATQTHRLVQRVAHTGVRILDTRKTTPLWRSLEKYGVRIGGGHNHRLGLDDGVLIKENHIALAGGLEPAVRRCRERVGHLQKIEVEVRTLQQLEEALDCKVEVVLLDNMDVQTVREASEIVRGACLLEVSGGVNESNIVDYAESGIDFISLGRLTHSYAAVDVSLLIEPDQSAPHRSS